MKNAKYSKARCIFRVYPNSLGSKGIENSTVILSPLLAGVGGLFLPFCNEQIGIARATVVTIT